MTRRPLTMTCLLMFFGVSGCAYADETWTWQVSERPPELHNPVTIDVSKIELTFMPASGIQCAGMIRTVKLGDREDAIIVMSGDEPLSTPIHVTGGRNVRIIGLDIDIATQPGCEIGELPNLPVEKFPRANIHPRVPGSIALRVEQWRTTFIEGLKIDVAGHQADCIVSRNPDEMTHERARQQRDVIVQNTYCGGVEGMGKTRIGDGVHGDLFQNQGQDILRRLVFENVSQRTSQEGIVLHGGGSSGLKGTVLLVLRRYDYSWDSRFVGDDDFERFGLAFSGKAGPDWVLEDVRIDDYRDGMDYINIDGQRYGESTRENVTPHPEIKSGLPPGGSFAPPEHTGVRYKSPHKD